MIPMDNWCWDTESLAFSARAYIETWMIGAGYLGFGLGTWDLGFWDLDGPSW